jgi:CubicO group peptidase (beta-lactamase class C family)
MRRLLLVFLIAACATTYKESPQIDHLISDVIAAVPEVPSMGVAIVKDGRTVYLREANTPYYIGSTTKAYTGLACAILAQRGKLDLDAPISKYLPEVTMANAPTLRAFLTHTSGISNDPIVFRTAFTGEHTPAMLVSMINASKPIKPGFSYDNLGYVIASLVIERITGKPWQQELDELVFTPLGMNHTTAYMSEAEQWKMPEGHAVNRKGEFGVLAYKKNDMMMHAAGGIVTTPSDLARWLNANIAKQGGGIPRAAFEEAQKLQVPVAENRGDFKGRGYGFGWYQADFKGENAMFHGGGFPGWQTWFTFLPDKKIGIGLMVNGSGPAGNVMLRTSSLLYDMLLGKTVDTQKFVATMKEDRAKGVAGMLADIEKRSKRPWMLKHANDAYTGRYENADYGTLTIAREGDHLVATLANLRADLEAFTEPETARVELVPGNGEVLRFKFAEGAEKPNAVAWGDGVFTRVN